MKRCLMGVVFLVAISAVLAAFFVGALFGPLARLCGPATELRATPELEVKIAVAVFALVALVFAPLLEFVGISAHANRPATVPTPAVTLGLPVLLC